MQFKVKLKRSYGENQTENEDVEFNVSVEEDDCYEMVGDNNVSITHMKNVAVEYALGRFFKQGYVMNKGSKIEVVSVEVEKESLASIGKIEIQVNYNPHSDGKSLLEKFDKAFKSSISLGKI